jgi:hypothetical protein
MIAGLEYVSSARRNPNQMFARRPTIECLMLMLLVSAACRNTTLDLTGPRFLDAAPGADAEPVGGKDAGPACKKPSGLDAGTDAGLAQSLVAWYPCDQVTGATLPDLSGNNNKASLTTGTGATGGTSFATVAEHNALVFNKANEGYASLPAGILAHACEMTVATWVIINSNSVWQRVWDFGTDGNVYMFLTTESGPSRLLRFAISINGNIQAGGSEQSVDGQAALPTGTWKHVAVVLGPAGAFLYVDGVQVGADATVTLRPADLGSMPNNYIGRSLFSADPYLDGAIDEFRVYDRALSPQEIKALASSW